MSDFNYKGATLESMTLLERLGSFYPVCVAVWLFGSSSLSAQDIGSVPLQALTVPQCSLIPSGLAHWFRAEGNGIDSFGMRHGTLQNGVGFTAGKVGQGFTFDGANDYVDLGGWFDLQVFTIAMWINPRATQQTYADIIDNNHTDGRSWVLQYANSGLLFNWGVAQRGSIPVQLTADRWQFLVITMDAKYVSRLYLDGVEQGSFVGSGPIAYDGTQFLRLSAWGGGGRHFNGEIDEVDIYTRALSQPEVVALFQAGSAGKCIECAPEPGGVAAWWAAEQTGADSVGGSPFETKNGADFVPGKVGHALQLDGVDDFAEVPDSAKWDFGTNDFSIELWANFRSLRASIPGNPAAVFVASDEGSGGLNKWLFSLGGGVLNFHINSPTLGPKFIAQAPFAPELNQWYHLALTRRTNFHEIFVNGVRIGSELNADAVPNADAPLTIGQAEGLGHMDGWIDELSIYGRALEGVEIQRILAADYAGKCSGDDGLPDLQITQVSAPEFVLPGDSVEVAVTITNAGAAEVPGNWLSAVYFSSEGSHSGLVGETIIPSSLLSGASMVITQRVTAPAAAGNFFLIVELDSGNRIREERESNNRMAATNRITLPVALQFSLSTAILDENEANGLLRGTIFRTGSVDSNLIVAVSVSTSQQLILPETVTIPAGQAFAVFDISAVSNSDPEGAQAIILTASAPDYFEGNATLRLTDSDAPRLRLEFGSATLTEGATMPATLRREPTTTNEVVALISNTDPWHALVPTSVTIPAGQAEVVFVVGALDNNAMETMQRATVVAGAPGFIAATNGFNIGDNDTPILTLDISVSHVSEAAGGLAAIATLRRSPVTAQPLYFMVQSSDQSEILVPESVIIPAGAEAVAFAVGTVDDALQDGTQSVQITTAMVRPASSIPLGPTAETSLQVIDNETPFLRVELSSELVREGSVSQGTVTRHGDSSSPLVINLNSSDLSEASVPASVTLGAGEPSATFEITGQNDNVTDGNKAVVLTASAVGFGTAAARVTVTESSLPDLVITGLNVPTAGLNQASFELRYTLANKGFGTLNGTVLQRVFVSTDPYLGNDDTTLGDLEFTGVLAAGQESERTSRLTLPAMPNDYWVIVVADATKLAAEILEENNAAISAVPVRVSASYFATVATSTTMAPTGSPVLLSGTASDGSGAPVAFMPVGIYIDVAGTRRIIPATTDHSGHFTAVFNPLPGEMGVYEISAAHPAVTTTPPQDTFILIGMRLEPSHATHQIQSMTAVTNTVSITNPSHIAQSGLSAMAIDAPPELEVAIDIGNRLPASGSLPLTYRIRSLADLHLSGTLIIRVTSAEGGSVDLPVQVTVLPRVARLVASPADLSAGMVRGEQTILEFAVANEGGIETGPIQLALPQVPWLKSSTELPLRSLEPGESQRVVLQLTPPGNLTLGENRGVFLLSSSNAHTSVPFSFVALSVAVGDLRVVVEDEFTYYAAGSPKVTNALVTVRDAITGESVTNGVTGAQGEIVFRDLREAYYNVEVTAEKHTTFRRPFLIEAGKENALTAFVSRQAVQYFWTVVPTTIEDRTRITIETVFETVVPMPVITIDPPIIDLADVKGEIAQVDVKITNHGLIAGEEMQFNFGTHPRWSITPLVTNLGTIAAQQTITVPVLIRRIGGQQQLSFSADRLRAAATSENGPCSISGAVDWSLQCGGKKNKYEATVSGINANADCVFGGGAGTAGGTTGSAGGGGGSGFGNSTGTSSGGGSISFFAAEPPIIEQKFSCEPCDEENFEPDQAFTFDVSGAFSFLAPIIEKAIEAQTGGFVHPEVTIKAEGGFQTCCNDGNQGIELYGAASAGLEIGVGPVFEQKAGLTVTLESNPAVSAQVEGSVKAGIELSGGLTLSAGVSSGCGDGPKVTASAEATVGLFAGLKGEVTAKIEGGEHSGEVQPVSINGSLNGKVTVTVSYAEGNATTKICSEGIYYTAMGSVLGKTFNLFSAEKNYIVEPYCPGGVAEALWLGDVEKAALEEIQRRYVPMLQARARQEAEALMAARNAQMAQTQSILTKSIQSPQKDVLQGASAGEGVCARVRLRLDQDLVMTRNAFNATLELINNNEGIPLENISMEIHINNTNRQGANTLFGLRSAKLSGALTGVDGTGVLRSSSSGSASWVLIPTNEAAPEGPTEYSVGGLLTYTQEGRQIVVPLQPVTITVYPDARLRIRYFHQRDVFSDDPFTPTLEPAEPFALGVFVQNIGKGAAQNVRIASAQPKIVENEKGLLIDFKIIGAQVGTNSVEPTLTANFGTIPPDRVAVGQWLLQSSLQGQFIEYDAKFEHIDSLGDPRLSLIETVEIHEMIRAVQAAGEFEDGLPDFLVNDVVNGENLPDTIYLSDGRIMPVQVVTSAARDGVPTASDLVVQLTAAMSGGWTYLRIPEPGAGVFRLTRVLRSDGRDLSVGTNVWITDRTFIENSRRPLNETNLHLIDFGSTGSYTLYYDIIPTLADITAPVSSVTPLEEFSTSRFTVSWSGRDEIGGSGVASFDVFVSENGGPFTNWLTQTRVTAGVFEGRPGQRYSFYSIASDGAGNWEATPSSADASTTATGNTAPSIATVPDVHVLEGETVQGALAVSDDQNDRLTFGLESGPAGFLLDPNTGKFTWVTGEAHGPATHPVTVRVQDDGSPTLGSTRTFNIVVGERNSAPILPNIPSTLTVVEGSSVVINAAATDVDLPKNSLQYSLGASAPTGAVISNEGLFAWTPSETQGRTTNRITIQVNDGGPAPLSDAHVITIVVLDTNSAPALAAISDIYLYEGDSLSITAEVTDPDFPADQITYSLESGAPAGAVLSPASGLLTWLPSELQAPSTNAFTIRAIDSGTPALSDSANFTVFVEKLDPGLNVPVFTVDGSFEFRFKGTVGENYQLQRSSNLRDWIGLQPFTAVTRVTKLSDTSAQRTGNRFYRVIQVQ